MMLINKFKTFYAQLPSGLTGLVGTGFTVISTTVTATWWLNSRLNSSEAQIATLNKNSQQSHQILRDVIDSNKDSWFKMNNKIDEHAKIEDKRYEQLSSRLREDVRTSTLSSVLAGAGITGLLGMTVVGVMMATQVMMKKL